MRKGIYKADNGNWYISTKVNGVHATIRGYKTKKDADNDYNRAIENWKRTHHIYTNDKDTYESLKENYLFHQRLEKTNETVRKDETQFKCFWDKHFSNTTASYIFDIKNLEYLYKLIINNNDYNTRKKSNIIKTFRDFAYYCYLKKVINQEIYQDIDIIFRPMKYSSKGTKERRVIPPNEIKAFLGVINKNHKDFPMFTIFVSLYARISEFLGICVDCYDRQNRKIEIKRQLLTNGKLTNKLKTNTSYRKILISKENAELLNDYIDILGLKNQDRIFKISHIEFKRRLRKYEDMANIPHYSSHEFRHTGATFLASKCVNMGDVIYCASILGHTKSMFLDTYCHEMNTDEDRFLSQVSQ